MSSKKTEKVKSDQQFQNQAQQSQQASQQANVEGANLQQQHQTGSNVATGQQESETQRQQRQATEQQQRQTGGGTTVGTSVGTGTSRQTGTGTNTATGGTTNQSQWIFKPQTADMDKFRKSVADFEGKQMLDPTIAFNAANQRRDALRMMRNPFGPQTTPETRKQQADTMIANIGQQEAQNHLQDAFNRSLRELQRIGLEGELAKQNEPMRELMGTQSTQTSTEARDFTTQEQNQQQQQQQSTNFQDTLSSGLSEMTGMDSTQASSVMQSLSDMFSDSFGYNVGTSDMSSESSGQQSQSGTSSGNQTTTTSTPIWGELLGGALGAGLAAATGGASAPLTAA